MARRVDGDPQPLDSHTTAQQLGALRRELIDEGFTEEQAADMAETAFRLELDFAVCSDCIKCEAIVPEGEGTDHWPSDNEIAGDAIRYFGRHIAAPAHEFAEQAIRDAAKSRDSGVAYQPYPEKPLVRTQAPDGSCVCEVCR